jgi:hypothetical protein
MGRGAKRTRLEKRRSMLAASRGKFEVVGLTKLQFCYFAGDTPLLISTVVKPHATVVFQICATSFCLLAEYVLSLAIDFIYLCLHPSNFHHVS